ncbi:hypothetical protein F511_43429 [Dorcoceras hygrometricum]|uniref:Uncharacterized protein n=1 Tax=Dorcoceras hygrometricum TaxID=472368 RepID=A0A2Z6ZZW2_9LAMI|nr:hypothetical protein F511_43429 [Dorcoceras hygrometricum]
MEEELKEMQGRYSEISLKFAEVEGERQQLMVKLRNLKNARKNSQTATDSVYESFSKPTSVGLFAIARSLSLKASLATLAEDITITFVEPNFILMRGPYFFVSWRRYTWGCIGSNSCRFPISGSPFGPGGRREVLFGFFDFNIRLKRKTVEKERRRNEMAMIMFLT